jgi:hypothetical protein
MGAMRTRRLTLGIAAGLACFGLGILSTRLLGPAAPPGSQGDDLDAGPSIFIDPATIQLLPDASLRLELPPGFDAGQAR